MKYAATIVFLVLILFPSVRACAGQEAPPSDSTYPLQKEAHTNPNTVANKLYLERRVREVERHVQKKQRMTLLFESACLLFFAFDLLLIFFVLREYNILKGVVGVGPSGERLAGRNRIIAGLILLFSLTALIVWARPLVLPNVWLPGGMDAAIASAYGNHGDFVAASSILIDSIDRQFLSGKLFRDAVYAFFLIFWVSAELLILIVILKACVLLRDHLFRHIGSYDE